MKNVKIICTHCNKPKLLCPTCEGSGDNGVLGDPCECNTCMGNGYVCPQELTKEQIQDSIAITKGLEG